jgi:putative hydrolase of the HAD superfamily
MQKPSGIVFDFGDTVLKTESFDMVAGERRLLQFASHPVSMTAEEIQAIANELNRELETIKEESKFEINCQSFQRLLFEDLDISFSISYAEMERQFWHASVKYKPAEGIYELLDLLSVKGIKTGILSNTSFSGAVLLEELAKHGLADRFEFVISSADYGLRKPNPRILKMAVKKMKMEPQNVWFAGDRLEYDIAGAVTCGMCPVWYNPDNNVKTLDYPCMEIKSWPEFKDMIESLQD